MRVALYPRVSTADKGQDPRVQTLELQEYCQRRGWSVAGEYVNVGISGTKEKRPELDRLMADAHRRRFDAVLCWRQQVRFPLAAPENHAVPLTRLSPVNSTKKRPGLDGQVDDVS